MILPLVAVLAASSLEVPFVAQRKDTCGAAGVPGQCDNFLNACKGTKDQAHPTCVGIASNGNYFSYCDTTTIDLRWCAYQADVPACKDDGYFCTFPL